MYILIYFHKLFLKRANYFSGINTELRMKWTSVQNRNNVQLQKILSKDIHSKVLKKIPIFNKININYSNTEIETILNLKKLRKFKKIWRMVFTNMQNSQINMFDVTFELERKLRERIHSQRGATSHYIRKSMRIAACRNAVSFSLNSRTAPL